MLESLGNIRHPAVRSLSAALTTGSLVTFAAAIAIGITGSKDDSAFKSALYSSLAGAGFGALFGLIYTQKGNQKRTIQTDESASSAETAWKDWRNFIVTRKVRESEAITSFYLQPEDNGGIPNFQPGQFLTIKLNIPGQAKPVIRTYSLSDYAEPCTDYRLSIKREPTPKGLDVPPGVASNFMHDHIHEGSIIQAKPPSGKFILDTTQSLPAVLISNGVGITPMISMAKAATHLNPNRPIWFLHGARDGSFHAFRDEVMAIAATNPNLMLHFAYSRPREADTGHYHSTGYIDVALIRSLVMEDATYFLCGSPPFMDSIRSGLSNAGVPESHIFFEMFTKAGKSTKETTAATGSNDAPETIDVVFAQSQQTIAWDTNADSILEFAEAHELNPPFSCRQGICGTCQCKLLEGEVAYQERPTAVVEDGSVLICIAKPKTPKIVLDL